mgnify:CR=1 FL=1
MTCPLKTNKEIMQTQGGNVGGCVRWNCPSRCSYRPTQGCAPSLKLVIGDYYKPDLAILNICGGGFTVGGDSAGYAVKMINPKYVIPAHYGVFDVMDQTPDNFLAALKTHAPDVKPFVLEPGESVDF